MRATPEESALVSSSRGDDAESCDEGDSSVRDCAWGGWRGGVGRVGGYMCMCNIRYICVCVVCMYVCMHVCYVCMYAMYVCM